MSSYPLMTYIEEPAVKKNAFIGEIPITQSLPVLDDARLKLPQPFWDGHDDTVACYWKSWEIALGNLRNPAAWNSLIRPYIDAAFNDCLFMWDSAFILMFARYGCRAFDFQQTLDNFYAKQHPDGFICRQIEESTGKDCFERFNPVSTGPNILPWCEYEYFCYLGDLERLKRVFYPLLAYHRWMRQYRSWPDGSYFSSGWGCGMDNQPRLPNGCDHSFHHGWMSWIDATAQALFSANLLLKIGELIKAEDVLEDLKTESGFLSHYINEKMWNPKLSFYVDRYRDGTLSDLIGIGSYWVLMADRQPADRIESMLNYLEDTKHFNRFHRVPSLSASHPDYQKQGGYWRGSVWPPTNYLVLRALRKIGTPRAIQLAYEIASNHHRQVVDVFNQTGTVWENYAPESSSPGEFSKSDMVGWGGLGPIAVFLEEIFGLQGDVQDNILHWNVRQLEAHGIKNYPFGPYGVISLETASRKAVFDEPDVNVNSNIPIKIEVQWEGGTKWINVDAETIMKLDGTTK